MTLQHNDPNPYDFIPLENEPSRAGGVAGFECSSEYSGRITFDIRAITPICILQDPPGPSNPLEPGKEFRFASVERIRVVPGTSLKGMLRSVHEIVTNSAMGIVADPSLFTHPKDKRYLPLGPHSDRDYLTPTEVLFGHAANTGPHASQAGKVFIDDISLENVGVCTTLIPRPAGGQPKTTHRTFYFTCGRVLGRKRYYHQDPGPIVKFAGENEIPTARCEVIPADRNVTGAELRFINLSEQEIAALVYTMALEDTFAHKIGYGKPYGFGSMQMIIRGLEIEPVTRGVPRRFLSFDDPPLNHWTGLIREFRDLMGSAWQARPNSQRSIDAFRAMMTWQRDQRYTYPNYVHFKGRETRSMTLKDYQGRDTDHPVLLPQAPPVVPPAQAPVQPDTPQSDNASSARVIREEGRLETTKGYPAPYVRHSHRGKENQYRLDERSASAADYSKLMTLVSQGISPRILFIPTWEKIQQKNKKKKNTPVLRNVEIVEEEPE